MLIISNVSIHMPLSSNDAFVLVMNEHVYLSVPSHNIHVAKVALFSVISKARYIFVRLVRGGASTEHAKLHNFASDTPPAAKSLCSSPLFDAQLTARIKSDSFFSLGRSNVTVSAFNIH